jgi:hypothetical protein
MKRATLSNGAFAVLAHLERGTFQGALPHLGTQLGMSSYAIYQTLATVTLREFAAYADLGDGVRRLKITPAGRAALRAHAIAVNRRRS